ncbi:MAG: helix-hairpin-helix domain-containing protein [Bacteroidia bacterium]
MKGGFKAFEFSQSEQKGIWALVLIIILSFGGFKIYYSFFKDQIDRISEEELNAIITEIRNSEQNDRLNQNSAQYFKLFPFNPNTINYDSLRLLGFSVTLSKRFLKFRSSLGGFKSKNEVKKIYGLSDSFYLTLEPFIVLVQDSTTVLEGLKSQYEILEAGINDSREIKVLRKENEVDSTYFIELNSATEQELMRIRGIGEVLSKRIIKFREAIGGFLTVNQLYEVYGVDSQNLDFKRLELMVDTSIIRKINVNTASIIEFSNHSFISKYQSKIIVAYREQHGYFNNISDVMATKAFTKSQFLMVSPYLTTQ